MLRYPSAALMLSFVGQTLLLLLLLLPAAHRHAPA
jgi:hypothetical protein